MLKCLECINWKKTGIFAAGVAFGTAGIKILSSKDAKKLYTNCTAAVLRAKECVLKTATKVQENAEDIYAEAQQINEDRAEAEEVLGEEETVEAETRIINAAPVDGVAVYRCFVVYCPGVLCAEMPGQRFN